jgi:hypothetical protein
MMVNLKTSDKSNERQCKLKIEILCGERNAQNAYMNKFVLLERRKMIYMSQMMRKKVGAMQSFVITLCVISSISIIT